MNESELPEPLREALGLLRAGAHPDALVDIVVDNWAYVRLPKVHFDQEKYPEPAYRQIWIRIPIQFPFANPHGLIARDPITPRDGHAVQGHNPGHDMCKPVAGLGGGHYYSWSWGNGPLGQAPALSVPSDILKVIAWYERRIRLA